MHPCLLIEKSVDGQNFILRLYASATKVTEMVSAENCIYVGILFISPFYSELYQIAVRLRLFT